tara:strand:- start:583 stop:1320 length:738 start_codon:yes stop_codon:yes gene_type:complete
MSALENIIITKETIKRLVKDVKELINNPLSDNGIYYVHSEEDILCGQALIIGPPDTPYKNGYYLFKFKFPQDYPHRPPDVTYCTNDGLTRFNPNLYKCGKVCISLLNTWKGPQWTGCQTISSILLSLCSAVLNDAPLLNEPGITKKHDDFKKYNNIITFKNYDIAIASMLSRPSIKREFPELHKIMINNFIDNYKNIIEQINLEKIRFPDSTSITTSIYRMNVTINFSEVEKKIHRIYKNIKKLK